MHCKTIDDMCYKHQDLIFINILNLTTYHFLIITFFVLEFSTICLNNLNYLTIYPSCSMNKRTDKGTCMQQLQGHAAAYTCKDQLIACAL